MKKIAQLLLFLLFLTINQSDIWAACPDHTDPACPDYDGPPIDPPTAPIDGGASLLVGAGVVYGMKRIRDNKKSKKDLKDTI